MLIGESLPFIRNYITAVNELIKQRNPENELTYLQSLNQEQACGRA